MTYRSIGLSSEQVIKDVFQQANIEVVVHEIRHFGTAEAILCTTEHDEAIRKDERAKCNEFFNFDEVIRIECEKARADERRKFKEWFKKSNHYLCYSDTIEKVMADYEKEVVNGIK